MKPVHLIFISIICFSCNNTKENHDENASEAVTTTYYFIRHAEKDRTDSSDKNPHLTDVGNARAEKWSNILGDVKFDAVYSTDYNRTRETAKPTASKNHLEIKIYDPNTIDAKSFMQETKGQNVLIVGHSNTTPAFVNKIIGHKKYEDIDDSNNGNLYIVTITGNTITDQVLTIN